MAHARTFEVPVKDVAEQRRFWLGVVVGFGLGSAAGLLFSAFKRPAALSIESGLDRPEPIRRPSSAWRRTWDRPVRLDEDSIDPLTLARMTDHNAR